MKPNPNDAGGCTEYKLMGDGRYVKIFPQVCQLSISQMLCRPLEKSLMKG
jgi:hypothetical protein